MKLTFKLVTATDLDSFEKLVNEYLTKGYRFLQDQPMTITLHEDITGHGYQYSIPMLKEEQE